MTILELTDGGGLTFCKGPLQIGDVDAHKALQLRDVAIIGGVIAVFCPVVHLLVDAPLLEVLRLCLPDGSAQTVDMTKEISLQAAVCQFTKPVVARLDEPGILPKPLENLLKRTVPQTEESLHVVEQAAL